MVVPQKIIHTIKKIVAFSLKKKDIIQLLGYPPIYRSPQLVDSAGAAFPLFRQMGIILVKKNPAPVDTRYGAPQIW